MQPRIGGVLAAAGAATVLATGLGGCGAPTLDGGRLLATLRTELENRGVHADDLTCAEDLPARVGGSVRCTFAVEGQPVDAVATVESVDGAEVTYDLHTEARPVAESVLERTVVEQLARQAGAPVGTADCAADLPARAGATVACVLTGLAGTPDDTSEWTVRTTSVDGGKIDYSIEQAGRA